jgi:iron complex outermembrane receptor protein/vitamin B12 transporter
MHKKYRGHNVCSIIGLLLVLSLTTFATENGVIRGTVTDPLGAVVAGANVELLHNQQAVASSKTDGQGNYSLDLPATGRYQIRAGAPSFQTTVSDAVYLSRASEARVNVTLSPGTLTEQITVTATGTPTPEAQIGYSVTVLTDDSYQHVLEAQDPLRLVPGVQFTQVGQQGSTTSLFIRGGNSDASKVLIDGLPAGYMGGFTEFATLPATGIEQMEVLRGPNSALYGSDALAGVVSMTTTRGTTPLPLLTYSADGGNFGTYHQQATVGGAFRRLDYFSAFSTLNTRNSLPDSGFHSTTYAGNFGWTPQPGTDLRLTIRRVETSAEVSNALQLYGIPDDEGRKDTDTYIGITFQNQTTSRWHNLMRYGAVRLDEPFTDYAPTGIPSDCFGAGYTSCYIGAPVTIHGANGYTVSGQAIFQYPGTYPAQSVQTANRDFVYAQSDYRFTRHLTGLVGFNYEDERGVVDNTGYPVELAQRGNYSYTMQLAGDVASRLYYTLGSGIENNALFGVAATPRASLAYYLLRPRESRLLNGTKLRASFGKGIKEPSIDQQANSLVGLLSTLSDGNQLIAKYDIAPVGAQTSRSYDGGIDQQLFDGRGKISVTYFHNEFGNGVEYVPAQGLVALGVPTAVAQATEYGAYVNSLAYRAQGAEIETEYRLGNNLFLRGGYTYLDAVVQRSFSSDNLGSPTTNPLFPGIPIGVFSPLVGARPFRQAPHSGYFAISYKHPRWFVSVSGTLVSRRDDSDFLYDQYGGNTMLLPNRNLDSAYQRIDATGSYQLHRSVQIYTAIQNLLSQHYDEAFGFAALPLTFRSGIKFELGGESWKLK